MSSPFQAVRALFVMCSRKDICSLKRSIHGLSASHSCLYLSSIWQVLANRPDIIREDYMNELCILQDDVPPFPNQVQCCCQQLMNLRHPYARSYLFLVISCGLTMHRLHSIS